MDLEAAPGIEPGGTWVATRLALCVHYLVKMFFPAPIEQAPQSGLWRFAG